MTDLELAVRDMIEARRTHFRAIVRALELCIARSPDAPREPNRALSDEVEATQARVKALLPPESAVENPLVTAARALFRCFARECAASVCVLPDDGPAELDAKYRVATEWKEEHRAAWARLAELVGAEPIDWHEGQPSVAAAFNRDRPQLSQPLPSEARPGYVHPAGTLVALLELLDAEKHVWLVEVALPGGSPTATQYECLEVPDSAIVR